MNTQRTKASSHSNCKNRPSFLRGSPEISGTSNWPSLPVKDYFHSSRLRSGDVVRLIAVIRLNNGKDHKWRTSEPDFFPTKGGPLSKSVMHNVRRE